MFSILTFLFQTIFSLFKSKKDLIIQNSLQRKELEIEWMDYSGYRTYEQFYPPFEHGVSIVDLIFHTGQEFGKYMKSF